MAEIKSTEQGAILTLSADELLIVNNALAAVCHGVRVTEDDFPTLIGASREEGRALLRQLGQALEPQERPNPRAEASAAG